MMDAMPHGWRVTEAECDYAYGCWAQVVAGGDRWAWELNVLGAVSADGTAATMEAAMAAADEAARAAGHPT